MIDLHSKQAWAGLSQSELRPFQEAKEAWQRLYGEDLSTLTTAIFDTPQLTLVAVPPDRIVVREKAKVFICGRPNYVVHIREQYL